MGYQLGEIFCTNLGNQLRLVSIWVPRKMLNKMLWIILSYFIFLILLIKKNYLENCFNF